MSFPRKRESSRLCFNNLLDSRFRGNDKDRQRGYILLPVVLAMTLIAAIAFLLNREGAINSELAAEKSESSEVDYLVRAGLAHAGFVANNSGCSGDATIPSTNLDGNSYTATVTAGGSTAAFILPVDQDTWIRESSPTQNRGSDAELRVKNVSVDQERSLYRFDLSTLSAGIQINSAVAWFFVKTNDSQGHLNVHRITADWTESGAAWDNINSNFDDQILAIIPAQTQNDVWVKVNLTSQVQSWVNGADPNFGVMLRATSDNNQSRYTSREWGTVAEQPYLKVVVGTGSPSPATISATGTLANGISRTVNRTDIRVYQPKSYTFIQPGAALDDAYTWDGGNKDNNFGASPVLSVNDASAERTTLMRFNLAALPPGARVTSARLGLYLEGGKGLSNGVLDLHRITRSWIEGIQDKVVPGPEGGVTYNSYDGANPWATGGGDYDPTPIDSVTISGLTPGWYEWNVSNQIQAWLAGDPNYGFLLRANSDGNVDKIDFTSGDSPITDQHPRLIFEFQCECGIACVIPETSGNVLMVVGDDTNLDATDSFKKELLEAWGYSVELLDDNGSSGQFVSGVNNNNVVYISGTVASVAVGALLSSAPIGVVNEEGALNNVLGISSGFAEPVGSAVNVVDSSHYITAPFALGSLNIYSAAMKGNAVGGAEAPGLQTLAQWGIVGGLATLDSGALDASGRTVAGPRVLLPTGNGSDINWDYVNHNGRLILQRALQWGMDGTGACGGNYRDEFTAAVFNNSDGSLDWAGDWIEVDAAGTGASVGKVRIRSGEIRLRGRPSGSSPSLAREMDLSSYQSATLSFDFRTDVGVDVGEDGAVVEISANGGASWTVLEDFINAGPSASGSRSYDITPYIATNTQVRFRINTLYGGPNEYFYVDNVDIAASCDPPPPPLACDADYTPDTKVDEFYGGVEVEFASGLTFFPEGKTFNGVNVPAGGAWIVANDGQNSLHLRDSNSNELASCNLGLLWNDGLTGVSWVQSGTWADHLAISVNGAIGSSDYVAIVDFNCNQQFSFDTQAFGSFAPSDVTYIGKTTSGNYDGHLAISDPMADQIFIVDQAGVLQVSRDVSGFATNLQGLAHLPNTDKLLLADFSSTSAYRFDFELLTQESYGLSSFGISDPRAVAVNLLTCDHVHVDDFDGSKFMVLNLGGGGGPACDGTFRDEFAVQSYSNNDGTLNWATDWLEINESNGPTAGDERVKGGSLRVRDNDGGGEGVQREADLTGAGSATLNFDYKRKNLDNASDYVTVDISSNGNAGPWTELNRFEGPGSDASFLPVSYDISAYISNNTRIRFLTSPNLGNKDELKFDNVEIQCSP